MPTAPPPDAVISNFAGPQFKWIYLVTALIVVLFPLYWLVTNAFKLEQEMGADCGNERTDS